VIPCAQHAEHPATRHCAHCGRHFCAECTLRSLPRGVTAHLCPDCDGLGDLRPVAPDDGPAGLALALRDAWFYPLRGRGKYALLAAVLLWAALRGLVVVGGVAAAGLAAFAVVVGGLYLTTFLLEVISRTADGDDTLPDWPELAQLRPSVGAGLVVVALVLGVTILPGEMAARLDGTQSFVRAMAIFGTSPTLAPTFGDALDGSRGAGLTLGVLLLLQCYAPMALLLAALGAGWRGLDPRLVLPAIRRAGAAYAVACGALMVPVLLQAMLVVALAGSPVTGVLVGNFVTLWLLVASMRVIGLLHRTQAERLALE
jgi:hypothetical protein